jgi:hypothetical protein
MVYSEQEWKMGDKIPAIIFTEDEIRYLNGFVNRGSHNASEVKRITYT